MHYIDMHCISVKFLNNLLKLAINIFIYLFIYFFIHKNIFADTSCFICEKSSSDINELQNYIIGNNTEKNIYENKKYNRDLHNIRLQRIKINDNNKSSIVDRKKSINDNINDDIHFNIPDNSIKNKFLLRNTVYKEKSDKILVKSNERTKLSKNNYNQQNFSKNKNYNNIYQNFDIISGRPVILRFRRGVLKIETQAIAMDSGSIGDIIKVRNISSNKVINCRIIETGIVEVIK
ncbi:flagella basal body P-ring formation protein FlgA [Lyticum sinuosum]|uniref:Flagellar basal body P-ring biosynthesis protein FlgA n=1 Tax=Lyticum sinuosum TaxID=1332059 RepID=A0AAE4VJN3_9RICK|nr:flagella basal body P-ring formation protein FlgA [Lyticum sinuosum]MDZ5761052.1 flagellar basal body P-ring biosynthesis protein FlgA [Lyticum sinuosum]